jgi:hypothetical protein
MWRKGKKVDWYLSIAGFWQLCVIGSSGSLYTASFQPEVEMPRIIGLGVFDGISIVLLIIFWVKARKRLKR